MTTLLVIVPVLVPALAGAAYAVYGWRPSTRWVGAGAAALLLASGVALAGRVINDGPVSTVAGQLRADALSAFMVIVIGAVALIATSASPAFLDAEVGSGRSSLRTAGRYGVLVQAFVATMVLAVLAASLGTLWVAVEATTIATAFLVGQRGTRAAVEAAWKYVVICSVGIALAFLGAVLLNFASDQAGVVARLDWAQLVAGASGFDPDVTRLAVALLVIGFGAKAGLAPLHAWLADAHGQAPAPVSALMSGVLLAVAFYAILRVKVIADAALGPGLTRTLLAVMAIATLAVAATLLIAQRDYKRMLAYSSMEHLGLIALGTAAGSRLAIAVTLLHVLGHGLVKAVAFLGAGRILQTTGSSMIARVHGLGAREPVVATAFGLAVLALVGMPPFSVFASTIGIVRVGFADGLGWVFAAALVLVAVIAAALLTHTSRMLLGSPPERPGTVATPRTTPVAMAVPLAGGLVAAAVLGITLGPLQTLLDAAVAIVGTTP